MNAECPAEQLRPGTDHHAGNEGRGGGGHGGGRVEKEHPRSAGDRDVAAGGTFDVPEFGVAKVLASDFREAGVGETGEAYHRHGRNK